MIKSERCFVVEGVSPLFRNIKKKKFNILFKQQFVASESQPCGLCTYYGDKRSVYD